MNKPEQKLILVVDDDQPINELVKMILETRGYRVVVAVDGLAAVEAARAHRPDLVVLDIMIPELSGFDVCERLKTDPGLKHAKIVMLSAKSLEVDKDRARHLGADAYLTKPVRLADLLDTVNHLLFPELGDQ